MYKTIKKGLSFILSAAIISLMTVIPSVSASAAELTPIVSGDEIKQEWKFSFGENDKDGYIHVSKTAHPVMGDLETGVETGYGFVGTYEEDFNFSGAYDALSMVKGHITELKETANGIGSVGSEAGTDGFDYPLKFAMYCDTGDYFRVSLTLTNLEAGEAKDVTVYSERKHVIVSHETITEGEEMKLEFSVDVEPVFFKGDGMRFVDDMLNISVAGRNVALKDMIIQKVEPGTTLWVLGDSTVTDGGSTLPLFNLIGCTGTGTSLSKYLPKNVAVSNQGEGGLNAWDNQHFAVADENIKAGDYMYVQYGHNHKNDGEKGYLGALDKYYQSCKRVGATLVIVSPIERHYAAQYNAAENKWSPWLAGYAVAGKGYVDCMIYGGETAAAQYVSTYDKEGVDAAEAYKESVLDANSTERKVTNIAFVDMNSYALEWLASISKEGTVMGTKYTNNAGLVDYYYQDATHPNDLGSEGLAEGMFLKAAEKIAEYPALAGLLKTYEGEIPADNSTASGRKASKVPQRIMDISWAWGDAYPEAVSAYEYPTVVRRVNFNDDGSLENMEVGLLDKSIMPTYGRGIVALYDEEGKLVKTAISNATEGNEKGYVGWVDNASDPGVQTLGFEGNNLNVNDGASIKAFIWGMLDQEGYPLTMKPYTDGTYEPVEFDYLVTNDTKEGPENFHFYGLKADKTFVNKNGWWVSPDRNMTLTGTSKCEGEEWYGAFAGTAGNVTHSISETKDGIIRIDGKIRNVQGKFKLRLLEPVQYPAGFDCFTIENGKVTDNAGNAHTITISGWTDFEYTLDLDKGESKLVIGDYTGETIKVSEYSKLLTDEMGPLPFATVVLRIENGSFEMTNFAVKNMTRKDALPKSDVRVSYVSGCDESMGTIAGSETADAGSAVKLSAVPNSGYRFIGWYDKQENGNRISTSKTIEVKTPCEDVTLYAMFEVHEGFYFDDSFNDYETGTKITQYGNDKPAAPEDVTLGGLVLSAGYRANGGVDGKAYISVDEVDGNKYMTCSSGGTSSSGRGVKFVFASPIDMADAKANGKSIVWEFDLKAENAGMTVLDSMGEYAKANITASEDWVNVKFIFDPVNLKKYMIVTDKDGIIEKLTASDLDENAKLVGATFYDYGEGKMMFDNMKIYDLGTDGTSAKMPQSAAITAPTGTQITIAGNTYTAGENGIANAVLTEGKYSVTAACAGYSDYSGEIVIDDTYAAEIEMTAKTTSPTTVTVNYVDENDTPIKEAVTIDNLYEEGPFELDIAHTYTIKNETDSGLYDIYVYNSENSDALTIESLGSENTINLVFDSMGTYAYYEDYSSSALGEVTLGGNALKMIENDNTAGIGKYLNVTPNSTSGNRDADLSFDVDAGVSEFECDMNIGASGDRPHQITFKGSGVEVFSLTQLAGGNDLYINCDADNAANAEKTTDYKGSEWIKVKAACNFTDHTITLVITSLDGKTEYYNGTVPMKNAEASMLDSMNMLAGRGWGHIGIDNIKIK